MEVLVVCSQCKKWFDEVVSLHTIAAGKIYTCECPNCLAEQLIVVNVSATVDNVTGKG